MIRNESSALMNEPYRNVLRCTVNVSLEKSGLPAIAATSGVIRSATTAATTAVNAVPMTTATARSMTLPRERKVLKPFTYLTPCAIDRSADDPCRPNWECRISDPARTLPASHAYPLADEDTDGKAAG